MESFGPPFAARIELIVDEWKAEEMEEGEARKMGGDEDEGDEPSPCLLRCLQFTWPFVSVLLD